MFDINPGLMVWTVATFVVLLIVLSKFAWKPLLQSLKDREDTIRQALEMAERARADAAELLKQNELNLAKAEDEYQKIIREGKAFAEKLKEEVVAKAHQQAQREIQHAKEEIQRDVDAAKQQLRTEVADLAVLAAGKILDETLDAAKHRKIVDSFLNQLPNS
ncbi:MAG: F0F1 ATP synthase subunit B [Ignavibacteriales bacterium]|nr:F0F1 ATP synthase subunit B [Ignavibacteriales bacterium]